jgi:integrase
MEPKYILKGKETDNKTIHLKIKSGKLKFTYSLHFKVSVNDWNDKKQRVRENNATLDNLQINNYLNDLEKAIKDFLLNSKIKKQSIDEKSIKDFLNIYTNKKTTKNKNIGKAETISLIDFINTYVEDTTARQSINTGKPLTLRTKQHFKRFQQIFYDYCKENGFVDFNDIDLQFYNDFSLYLQNIPYSINTIGKYIRTLKTILNEATAKGINNNLAFKSARFKIIHEPTTAIYLTQEEIKRIENVSLPQQLDNIRVSFLIGCYTGLRYSDFSRLTADNITNNKYIKIIQQKTGNEVVIPLHPYIKALIPNLNKYKNIPNYVINNGIKEVCRLAEIKDKVIKEITRGGKKERQVFEKWQLVGCHTARRSFATNSYLNGVPAITIIKITGHKTEKAFLSYIKITNEQNADIMAKYWEKMED